VWKILMSLEGADELHDGVDAKPHRVKVEYVRELLGVDLVQAFLEHFCLFQIRLLPSVLAP
jgi:hypothetical protein